ncbi:MAG: SDR family oxidoreductase [Acholeplasma sp.]|nr:SDR family oxidoreductase [Acholeplasma sp.]
MNKKHIYITGIAGMLGSNLAYELKGRYFISGVDLIEFNMPDVNASIFDILDYEKLRFDIEQKKPDIIIHTAAYVDVDGCERNSDKAYLINVHLTLLISSICSDLGIKLIYISTDAVYADSNILSKEDDLIQPINVYGITKLMAEHHVLNINGLVIRTNIFGINYQNKQSFAEWIIKSLQEGKTIELFHDVLFSPILVNDLAEIINKIILKDLIGIYNVCSTGYISKHDFGVYLKEKFHIESGVIIKSSINNSNLLARRQKNMSMSNSKISSKLDIIIKTPKESIISFFKNYNANYFNKEER